MNVNLSESELEHLFCAVANKPSQHWKIFQGESSLYWKLKNAVKAAKEETIECETDAIVPFQYTDDYGVDETAIVCTENYPEQNGSHVEYEQKERFYRGWWKSTQKIPNVPVSVKVHKHYAFQYKTRKTDGM